MAAAKKCDICGTFYDNYNMNNYKPNCLKLANEHVVNNKYLKLYDCCPDCMKSIEECIDSLKPKKEEA